MLQLCVCRDIEHLGSLESTQEARVALGCLRLVQLLRLFRALQTSRVLNRDLKTTATATGTPQRGLISKTTILHVHHDFLYISLPSLHDYDVKMPNFTMYRGSTQATTKFPLSF